MLKNFDRRISVAVKAGTWNYLAFSETEINMWRGLKFQFVELKYYVLRNFHASKSIAPTKHDLEETN